jgi:hypothetical protein
MYIRQLGLEGVDGIHLAQDREWWRALMTYLSGSIKDGEFPDELSDY